MLRECNRWMASIESFKGVESGDRNLSSVKNVAQVVDYVHTRALSTLPGTTLVVIHRLPFS